MGSILGGILGGGSSPGQQSQMNAIHGSAQDYQAYRQEMAQALLNTLNQANSAYQGTNNALETLYGAPGPKSQGLGVGGAWDARPSQPSQPMPSKPTPPMGGSSMGNAPRHASSGDDPWITAGQALLDPAGVFTKGIGGLF